MRHDNLWAPWRLAYIKGADPPREVPASELKFLPGADETCFLCRYIADQGGAAADRQNYLVERTERSVVVLNRYPYNNGHLLVAPLEHRGEFGQLTPETHLDLQQTIGRYVALLRERLGAEGFNIGLNLNRVAGAGLVGHLHWHIVPRWSGDAHFMGVVGGVEIIAQSLDALWDLLKERAQ